jgi:AcrR family transcriptional regulator
MDDIAAHAGVGVGTAYRRFRSRDELIDALFEERMHEVSAMVETAAADPDPWHGLVTMMETSLAMQAADRGLKHLFHSRDHNRERVAEVRAEIFAVMQTMVDRAHASGDLRPDVTLMDLTVVSLMVGAVADVTADEAPHAWRRALALALDGLRPGTEGSDPLPGAAISREQFEAALECWRPPAPPIQHGN